MSDTGPGSGMSCPSCGELMRTLDTRPIAKGSKVKRRRECPECGTRVRTYETIDEVTTGPGLDQRWKPEARSRIDDVLRTG